MKVVIATGLFPPESGGPATYARLLEERLPKSGIEVAILPFSHVRHLPPVVRHIAYIRCLVRMLRGASALIALDTVSVGLPALIASRLRSVPLVLRLPGDYAWEQGRQRFGISDSLDAFQTKRYGIAVECLRLAQRIVARGARVVVAPSKYLARIARGWGVSETRLRVIYNGIELPISTETPIERPEGFLVVSAGRLVPWKGFDGLIRIIARESSWHLVVVGDGPDRERLRALTARLEVEDRVLFTGELPRERTLGWVAVADAFALNSSYEGLSHLLVEALSLGAPTVATLVGGNPEVVRDQIDGLLIPSGNDEALCAALSWLADDRARAARLGASAKERARDFSIEKTVESMIAVLRAL